MLWECLFPTGILRGRARRRAQALQPPCLTLATLPRDVLDLICRQLGLKDRIALSCCCRALWTRPDVMGDEVLWGRLNLGPWDVSSERRQRSLAAWLARRDADGGLGRLRLYLTAPWYRLEGQWIARPGLAPRCDRGVRPLLGLLWSVRGLRGLELRGLGLKTVPAALAAMTALTELSLRGNPALGRGQPSDAPAFQPVLHLHALVRLDIRSCGLSSLPPQLSALVGLRDLDASVNQLSWCPSSFSSSSSPRDVHSRGGSEAAAASPTHPLRTLACLTRLDLSECLLRCHPPELEALTALAELSLGFESPFPTPAVARDEVVALRELVSLSRLELNCSGADPHDVRELVGPHVVLSCW